MQKWKLLKYNEIKTQRISDFETVFNIEPLERGFGATIATALRRTMLSSIHSLAPFALKILDVSHEFQALAGVVEDIQKIILNIKKIAFRYDSEIFAEDANKIIKGKISSRKGQNRLVRAGDFIFSDPSVQVVDEDIIIAEVTEQKAFEIEIFLLEGRGYVDFEENKVLIEERQSEIMSDLASGNLISIDSDFSPVKKVEIKVEEINSSSAKVEERVRLGVLTNGSLSGKEVMMQAANLLIAHFQIIGNIENLDKTDLFEAAFKFKSEASHSSKHIKDLNLSVRSVNALIRNGYTTLKEIATLTEDDLAAIKNLGKKSIKEIIDVLEENNINVQKGEE